MAGQERARAASIVHNVVDKGRSLDNLINAKDDGFVRALAYETLRWHHQLEPMALAMLDRRPRNRDIILLRLIETGLAQLMRFDIADHAAINETVAAAPRLKQPRAKGLVNAILRRFQRERSEIEKSLGDNATFIHAYPQWMIDRLRADWASQLEDILAAGNRRAPMSLRVNRRQSDSASYRQQLANAGIEASPSPFGDSGLVLQKPVDVTDLPGFDSGTVSVQDIAAQQAGHLLELDTEQPLRVLDACSAPGGKTGHISELASPGSSLTALDSSEARQSLTRETMNRLRAQAEILCGDAADSDSWWDREPFDRILLDAPCSASGVIRRHPDIKSLRRADDIASLCKTQSAILEALWPLLKPEGLLIYATCSIFKAENEERIQHFMEEHTDCTDVTPETAWGEKRPAGRQILPGDDDMDGFYYAALRKS